MQTNLDIFRAHCHYFDKLCIYHVETQDSEQLPVQAFECRLDDGRMMSIFLMHNPWKLIECNNEQIVYQYCISCGDKRFEDKKFNQIQPGSGESTISCKKIECIKAYHDLIHHTPSERKIFMFLDEIEKQQANLLKIKG